MKQNKLKVVLCWHMHQPHYRDGLDGCYRLPWVYLHAIKDYSDMVWHLEKCPGARVVVNFAPVLLEQLDDYQRQIAGWLQQGEPMDDPLLNWLAGARSIPQEEQGRLEIVHACQRAYAPTMINSLPHFRELVDLMQSSGVPEGVDSVCVGYLNEQFFIDLLVWYHLAWMGIGLRHSDARIDRLMAKKGHYNAEDRRVLMEAIGEAVGGIIPRYRALMESGQIEISMTPYGHPIVPLMIDFESMRDAQPKDPAPKDAEYPDGYERARWHIEHGFEVMETHFGRRPQGVWLSEGAISSAAVGMLDEYEIRWTASGEGVWRHSCEASHIDQHDLHSKKALYQPLQHASQSCALFFRDDGLSDLIGFQYKDWHPEDASSDFVQHMENIRHFLGEDVEEHVVTVILDGENAWEYYQDNASHFLTAMYDKLSSHPDIEMTTFKDALTDGARLRHLPVLKAGSWVYGSFSTWIGDADKNRAWDELVAAKRCYDRVVGSGRLSDSELEQATLQLSICEGSDWFWWFGDYNPSESVQDFDRLYRRHLKKLYELLGESAPERLEYPLSLGGGEMENAGTMRRNV